jgi:hypothetical protein
MSLLTVVPERISRATATNPARYIYHLAKGQWDDSATFQPVHCGGGISFPWSERVQREDVCRACLKAAKR